MARGLKRFLTAFAAAGSLALPAQALETDRTIGGLSVGDFCTAHVEHLSDPKFCSANNDENYTVQAKPQTPSGP